MKEKKAGWVVDIHLKGICIRANTCCILITNNAGDREAGGMVEPSQPGTPAGQEQLLKGTAVSGEE